MSGRVNENWLVLISLGLLCVVTLWLIQGFDRPEPEYPPMSTYSPKSDGAKALLELCRYAGFDLQQFHDSEYDYPSGAGVIILDKPSTPATALMGGGLDVRALRLWLEDGGRLLLFSEPLNMVAPELFAELDRGEGLTPYGGSVFEWESYPEETELPDGGPVASAPRQRPGFEADDRVIASWSSLSTNQGEGGALWRIYELGHRFALPADRPPLWHSVEMIETAPADATPYVRGDVLLATQDASQPVVLYRRAGRGEVFWITRPEIASNDWISRLDNHRLILALVEYVAQSDSLYVDEHIHGYVTQSPSAVWLLFNSTGGHLLLLLSVVFVLAFLGAAVRPAKFYPQPRPPRRQAAEMVLAQADLYRRAGSVRRAGLQLTDGVRRALTLAAARHGGLGVSEPAEMLVRLPENTAVSRQDVQLVLEHLKAQRAPSRRDLLKLAQACDAVRRALHSQAG
jgi:hypothetical protein